MSALERLAQLPAFQGLSLEDIQTFMALSTRVQVKPGDTLLRAGDQADCFYLLVEGKLEVLVEANGQAMPLAQVVPGQLVGEMPLIYNQPIRQADVQAVTDAKLFRFAYEAYEGLAQAAPEIHRKFRANLGRIVASRVWSAPASGAGKGGTGSQAPLGKPGAAGPAQPAKPAFSVAGNNRQAMKRAQIFAGFADDELEAMESIASPYPIQRGRDLVHAGDPANSFFLVVSGQMEVLIEKQGKLFPLARVGPGQVIGEMALIYKQPTRTATVMAADDSKLLVFPFDDYHRLVERVPGVGKKLRSNLGRVAAARAWSLPEIDEAKALRNHE